MGLKRTFADDSDMRQIAMDILAKCGGEHLIIRKVQALMNSNEDVLPKTDALDKLRALQGECPQPVTKLMRRPRPAISGKIRSLSSMPSPENSFRQTQA